jgi:hypothetical protein
VSEVEVDGDGIALGGTYGDGGGAGGKVFDSEIELQSSAGEKAAAVIGAKEIGLTGRGEGTELLVFAGDLYVEIFPKIIRARGNACGRAGTGAGRASDVGAVRIGELD